MSEIYGCIKTTAVAFPMCGSTQKWGDQGGDRLKQERNPGLCWCWSLVRWLRPLMLMEEEMRHKFGDMCPSAPWDRDKRAAAGGGQRGDTQDFGWTWNTAPWSLGGVMLG